MKYITTAHAKNQTFILSFAELLFLKTAVEMWLLNCSIIIRHNKEIGKDTTI
jgi:hypothetical protein